ncbi:hypothetical protein M2C68_20525, partial [Pseudomonas sp. BAgro211]|nr:hypothetical protein [Pseudomonas sp. BAgro211]
MAEALHRSTGRIGFFKPSVMGDSADADPMVALMRSRFDLGADMCRGGLGAREVRRLLASGQREEIDSR